MFTIDLLEGNGLPVKNRPEGIAISVAAFAVPAIIAIVMLGFYLNNKTVISIQKREIINYETRIGRLADAVKVQKSFGDEKDAINNSLSEVTSSINRHAQWSPILVEVVEHLPTSVILTNLSITQDFVKKEILQRDNSDKNKNKKKKKKNKKVKIEVPVRQLQLSITGDPRLGSDQAVRDFRNTLRFSAPLVKAGLVNIKVSQDIDRIDNRDVIAYTIDCIFKPELKRVPYEASL